MAIRTDIYTINWDVSPRLIGIDISVTEASVQDLYDTCRYLEALPEAMDEKPIIEGAGGEPLGLGTEVGLTVTLLNAQYDFADRPGPEWVTCNMAGGNVVAFTDETKTTVLYPRHPSSYVSGDRTASSSATLQITDGTGAPTVNEIWSHLIDSYEAQDLIKIMAAVLAGKVSGVGTDTEVFRNPDDTADRVTSTFDEDGNRLTVTHNV